MPRLLSSLLLIFAVIFGTTAQELKIESVIPDPVDLTAQTEMRKDLNGLPCALVKVRLTLPGAVFSGNVVGEVRNQVGEYYVYMTGGTKELRLKQERVKPVAIYFPDYRIPELEPGVTYVVDLSVPENLWVGPLAPKKEIYNYLLLRVTPADAKVFVDGQERSVMAGESSVLLGDGDHTLRVEASGYLTAEETVTISGHKVEKTVNLRSTKATLTVRSATPGAEILLNGRSVGSGQWTGSIMPDTYIVELRKEGYRPAEKRVVLTQNQTETLDFPALEAITGDLDITSVPSGATVELDGRILGTTPDIFRSIPVGSHTLRLTLSGYAPLSTPVTITETTPARLSQTLSKIPQSESSRPLSSSSTSASSPSASSPSSVSASSPFNGGYSSASPAHGHLKAAHLDLATEKNGQYVYFTESEWNRLPASEKSTYNKKGIVIDQPSITPAFILALTDNGKDVTWNEAMHSGINMPSKIQGEAIVKDCENVKNALKTFGGTGYKGNSQWFWTKEAYNSSKYWFVSMYYNGLGHHNLGSKYFIRSVAPVPVAASDTGSSDFNDGYSSASPAYGHLKAAHLDLATEKNGQYVYFTESEWNRLPASEKSTYNKKGIVIDQPSILPAFILALTDNGKDVTWNEAMHSGINMPSKIQGEAIVEDCESVKNALKRFGGTGYKGDSQFFWTKEAEGFHYRNSYCWIINMKWGKVHDCIVSATYRVRAVAPVPVGAM